MKKIMAKINKYDARQKLKILNQQGTPALITDIVRILDQMLIEEVADMESSDIEYAKIAVKAIYHAKKEYKIQLQVEEVSVKTRDIESLIAEIHAEEQAKIHERESNNT